MDCSLVSDGGGAFIVTSAERARDFRQKPIYILGAGTHNPMSNQAEAKTLTTLGGKESSKIAYKMAGLKPKDMDFAEIYDCFTFEVVQQLEETGFCARGEGGAFVEGGRIESGGALPVNTHGGLLSEAHVLGASHIVEAVRQLRGEAGARQLARAEIGVVTGWGDFGDGSIAVLRR